MAQAMIDLANSERRAKKTREKVAGVLELEGMERTPFTKYKIQYVPNWVQLRYVKWRDSNKISETDGIPVYDETKPRTFVNAKHDPQQFVCYGLFDKKKREKKPKTAEEEQAAKERNRERHKTYYRVHTKPMREQMKRDAELAAAASATPTTPSLTVDLTEPLKPMTPILDFAAPEPQFDEEIELARSQAHVEQLDKEMQSLGIRQREDESHIGVAENPTEEAPKKKKKRSRKNN